MGPLCGLRLGQNASLTLNNNLAFLPGFGQLPLKSIKVSSAWLTFLKKKRRVVEKNEELKLICLLPIRPT